jgi:hypothetical protein
MEYKVNIKADETRAFGFYLFKWEGAQPKSGSLSDLLASGQTNMWAPGENGGGSMVKGVPIVAGVASDDSAVTISVRDPQTIRQFREKKPPVVEIAVRTPPTSEQAYSIPVTYGN